MSANRIIFQIATPIILVGIFAIVVFLSTGYNNISIGAYAVLIIFTVFIFLFGFTVGQKLVSPIRQIMEKVEMLNKGDLNSRIYLEAKDEFAELAKSLNQIADKLERSHNEASTAESMADIKIRAKTHEMEEEMDVLENKIKNRAQELQKIIKESEELQARARSRESEIIDLKKEIMRMKEENGKVKIVKTPRKSI